MNVQEEIKDAVIADNAGRRFVLDNVKGMSIVSEDCSSSPAFSFAGNGKRRSYTFTIDCSNFMVYQEAVNEEYKFLDEGKEYVTCYDSGL